MLFWLLVELSGFTKGNYSFNCVCASVAAFKIYLYNQLQSFDCVSTDADNLN